MQKISILIISGLLLALASSPILARPGQGACELPGQCGACSCENNYNYTVYSYYQSYLYAPTSQMILVRTSIQPAEFLDRQDPK